MRNRQYSPATDQYFWLPSLRFCYCIPLCTHSLEFDSHSSDKRPMLFRAIRCTMILAGLATRTNAAARNARKSDPVQLIVSNVLNWCVAAPVDFVSTAAIFLAEIGADTALHTNASIARADCAAAWNVDNSGIGRWCECCNPEIQRWNNM